MLPASVHLNVNSLEQSMTMQRRARVGKHTMKFHKRNTQILYTQRLRSRLMPEKADLALDRS